MSVPASRMASRNSRRSPRLVRASVTTYRRARSRRSRLPTGDGPDDLQPIPVGQEDVFVPIPFQRLAVELDDHQHGIEAASPDEVGDAHTIPHLVPLAVRGDLHAPSVGAVLRPGRGRAPGGTPATPQPGAARWG